MNTGPLWGVRSKTSENTVLRAPNHLLQKISNRKDNIFLSQLIHRYMTLASDVESKLHTVRESRVPIFPYCKEVQGTHISILLPSPGFQYSHTARESRVPIFSYC